MTREEGRPIPDDDTIRWVSLPLRDERPAKSALLLAIVAATAALAAWQGWFYGLLAVVLQFILLGPYFLPCRFEISQRGVKKRFFLFSRERPWSQYKRYVSQRDGVFLSTFAAPSRLDSFRGDFVRFSRATDRERVMALVRANVGTP